MRSRVDPRTPAQQQRSSGLALAFPPASTLHRAPRMAGRADEPEAQSNAESSRQFDHDFSRIPVHGPVPAHSRPVIQTKLTIGRDDDEYEHEADRIAEQVMHMPEPRSEKPRTSTSAPHSFALAAQPASTRASRVRTKRSDASGVAQAHAPTGVGEVLRSGGQPLDASTRAFMEPRFGHDFAHVRVHTDAGAAQASQALHAQAYTSGHSIVFGAGCYVPHTHSGRQLLAHELSHVLQQQNRDRRIQRKELDKALVASNRGSVAHSDWLAVDREEWELASQGGSESMLSPTNTFMRAVYYNTENLRPQEYQTVRERHDYYDMISYVLEFDKGTPKALQDIRFFHATTAVTGSPGIGTVDTPLGALKLSQDTRQILREVNVELFALNMSIIQKLLFNWKEPRDPKGTSTDVIGSFQFDLRMVETEQSAVENYIQKNEKRFTSGVTGDINKSIDPDEFGQFFNFSRTSLEWAQKVLKTKKLDFLNIKHRKAIGFANVHIFHRKSYSDFERFFAAYSVIP